MKHPKHEHDEVPILNMNMKICYEDTKHLINFNQLMPNPTTTLQLAFSLSSCTKDATGRVNRSLFICLLCMYVKSTFLLINHVAFKTVSRYWGSNVKASRKGYRHF